MTWPIGFSSLIGCSFILEEAVIPESAKDSGRYRIACGLGRWDVVLIGTAIALLLLVAAPWTDKWLGSQSGGNKRREDVEQ
jgi:hypothetical protein